MYISPCPVDSQPGNRSSCIRTQDRGVAHQNCTQPVIKCYDGGTCDGGREGREGREGVNYLEMA